mgnify:CR=1 FL=1
MNKEKWLDNKGNEITEEYIIINKTAIQKRIEELKSYTYATQNIYLEGKNEGELSCLLNLLSQSTPLIPEIEKAFDASKITTGMNQRNQFAYKYKNSKDYVTNLKLDI